MADITIEEAIFKLSNVRQRLEEMTVEIMREEVPVKTGELYKSIHTEPEGNGFFVGTNKEYAYYVQKGRGEVKPKRAKALHWVDGGDVFAMQSKPTKPNDFVQRTKDRLLSMNFTL